MSKRTCYLLGILILLVFGSSVAFGIDTKVCPVGSTEGQTVLDLPQKETPVPENSASVPRNQVLLEIATSTG